MREFKGLVKALHRAGIEVILDVVYNHTAEGNHLGPMLAFKGIDNASYYRLVPDDPRHYMDFTGTGNSLNPVHPSVLRLITDSLRYWVVDCHVDGFRFDLASALARELYDVDRLSTFFDVIHQDPVLSQVKLIAEPWDVGPGGYQVGNFPVLWAEWNDQYRDTMRDLWRGHSNVAAFARRFTGSSDLYQQDGRHPSASINYVTCHDGFTLADLVAYDHKHNEANLEGNRDGSDDNRSWNCGVEGPTDDPAILALRERQQRNFLATVLLSHGVPMLLGGDEIGRTQQGNNNAWCQDNELSWHDWELDDRRERLLAFTRRLLEIRRAHPVFRRSRFLNGHGGGSPLPDAWWFRPDGRAMARRDWEDDGLRVVGLFLNGDEIGATTPEGEPIVDDSFIVLLNASPEQVRFVLPTRRFGASWALELQTAEPDAPPASYPARGQARRRRPLARAAAGRLAVRVLFATAELTPLAAVGGLAQAAAGLVRELRAQGVEVDVVLPDYASLELAGEEELELDVPAWAVSGRARRGAHASFGDVTLVSVPGIERPAPVPRRARGRLARQRRAVPRASPWPSPRSLARRHPTSST